MTKCDGCGASIDMGAKECPYCGHVLMKIMKDHSTSPDQGKVYRVDRESGTLQFGDGKHGARLESGTDSISSSYRSGGGKAGNVVVCITCKHENQPIHRHCQACGAELQRKILHHRREE